MAFYLWKKCQEWSPQEWRAQVKFHSGVHFYNHVFNLWKWGYLKKQGETQGDFTDTSVVDLSEAEML